MRTWSAQQQAIFDFFRAGVGNLVVRARAGTGKTTTILEGISHAPESNILLAAFNKRIAEELGAKLTNPHARAQTLHSIGFACVRRHWTSLRVREDRGFHLARVAWAAWQKREQRDPRWVHQLEELAPDPVITAIARLAALGKNVAPHATVADLVSVALHYSVTPENGWAEEYPEETLALLAHHAMALAGQRDGELDFDDMIFLPLRHGWARPAFDLVVIDEAQDMNAAQLELALGVSRGRIIVVGDDRQAIYAFRGADHDALDRLKATLDATELPLTTTYRCPRAVVAMAQSLVPDYTAAPEAPEGIIRTLPPEAMLGQLQPTDYVLSRTNAPLAPIALALLRNGQRARIEGRDVSRGLLALIRRMRADHIPDLLAKLDQWGARELATLRARKGHAQAVDRRAEYIADQISCIEALADGLADVPELIARIEELFADAHGPAIVCSTIHRAKGLEADRIYLLADTLYCGGHRHTREEENIHYVGLTRAKESLTLVTTHARPACAS